MWRGFSWKFHMSFHFPNRRQFGPNWHQIPWLFHLFRFYVFRAGTWHGVWTSSSHGISMAFAKRMMGFPVRIWSHFRTKPNCLQKDIRKCLSHFLQGIQRSKELFSIQNPIFESTVQKGIPVTYKIIIILYQSVCKIWYYRFLGAMKR